MPRLSARRSCFYLFITASLTFLYIVWHQQFQAPIPTKSEPLQASGPLITQQAPVLQAEKTFKIEEPDGVNSLEEKEEEPIVKPWVKPAAVLIMPPMSLPFINEMDGKNISAQGENKPTGKETSVSGRMVMLKKPPPVKENERKKKRRMKVHRERANASDRKPEKPIGESWLKPVRVIMPPMSLPFINETDGKNNSAQGENKTFSEPTFLSERIVMLKKLPVKKAKKKRQKEVRRKRKKMSEKKQEKPIGESLLNPVGANKPLIESRFLSGRIIMLKKQPLVKTNERKKKRRKKVHRGRTNISDKKRIGESRLKPVGATMSPVNLPFINSSVKKQEKPIGESWLKPVGVIMPPMNLPFINETDGKNIPVQGENKPLGEPTSLSGRLITLRKPPPVRKGKKKRRKEVRRKRRQMSDKKQGKSIGESWLKPVGVIKLPMNLPSMNEADGKNISVQGENKQLSEPTFVSGRIVMLKKPPVKKAKKKRQKEVRRETRKTSEKKQEKLIGESWLKPVGLFMPPVNLPFMNLSAKKQEKPIGDSWLKPARVIMPPMNLPFKNMTDRKNASVHGGSKPTRKQKFVSGRTVMLKKPPSVKKNERSKKRQKKVHRERTKLSDKKQEKPTGESWLKPVGVITNAPFIHVRDGKNVSAQGEIKPISKLTFLSGRLAMLKKPPRVNKKGKKQKRQKEMHRERASLSDKKQEKPIGESWLKPVGVFSPPTPFINLTNVKNNISAKGENKRISKQELISVGTIIRRKPSPIKKNKRKKKRQKEERRRSLNLSGKEQERPIVKPWFMSGGLVMPTNALPGVSSGLWPAQRPPGDDRITNQLMFRPLEESEDQYEDQAKNVKTILNYNQPPNEWSFTETGQSAFSNCPVHTCKLTQFRADSRRADAILFKDYFVHPGHEKPNNQVWILHLLDSPYYTQANYSDVINWTATYRRDSDLVTPYEKFVYYDTSVRQLSKPLENYAANKTKRVAWFVSQCHTPNSRLQYARELQKYISVDIHGDCGPMECPKSERERCFQVLANEYKFYLAFENSNCKDYITEKLFVNALQNNVLPIVMGARPEDYKLSAPEHSYIHVDDFDSPRALAEYLLLLDKDDEMYNSYFKWKGTGEFINTYFWCRLCAMLHDSSMPSKWYKDINQWWRGPGTCTAGSWNKSSRNWSQHLRRNIPEP